MRPIYTATAILALGTAPATAQDTFFQLDEIIFSATATPLNASRLGTSFEVLETEEIEAMGDIQLADVLTRLPGIRLIESGNPGNASQLQIRGAGMEYVGVYLDGILINDPSAIDGSFLNIGGLAASSIRRIEILRGTQSSLYGGSALGGVVNINTTAGLADLSEGTEQTAEIVAGSYGTIGMSYTLAHRVGDTVLSFGLSHVQSDGFSTADENAGNLESDPYDQTRLTFGIEHQITTAFAVGLNGFVESSSAEFDEFDIDGTTGDDRKDSEAWGLRLYGVLETGIWIHEANLTYYDTSRTEGSVTVGSTSFPSPVTTFDATRLALSYQVSARLNDMLALSFGLDAEEETARYPSLATDEITTRTNGGFAEAVWSPTDAVDVTATLRYDDHSSFGGETTGRVALAWRPSAATTIRAAIGTGYRPPVADELFGIYPGSNFVGNPNLAPETSLSYEIGLEHQFANDATVNATVFALNINNEITFCGPWGTVPPCPPGSNAWAQNTLVNLDGTSKRQGLELAASSPVNDWLRFYGAYTYLDARSGSGARLANIPRHDLVLGLDATLTNQLSVGLTGQFIRDRVFNPTAGGDYEVFHANVAYDLSDTVEAYFRIENLFDEEYQLNSGFGTSDRAVYLGLRAEF